MSDYIKREDAKDLVIECLGGMPRTMAEKLADGALDGLISDNVVEVVRCKDCRFNKAKDKDKGIAACGLMVDVHNADDYCSYGERKGGEGE